MDVELLSYPLSEVDSLQIGFRLNIELPVPYNRGEKVLLPYKMYCGVCEAITEHSRGTCTICLQAFAAREMEKQIDFLHELHPEIDDESEK